MSRNGSEYHRMLNTPEWRRLRRGQLDKHPFCEDCLAEGIYTPAEEVHHVIPVESVADAESMRRVAFDRNNLVSLCVACHHKRHEALRSHSREENERRSKERASMFWEKIEGGCFFERGGGP
ncbi:MAG: HNH endonuclease [Candidatus Amulumruptor caecigallinarius]|nr:HNH endonuclease [Candidatus Amulumruptor caecigallinarius]